MYRPQGAFLHNILSPELTCSNKAMFIYRFELLMALIMLRRTHLLWCLITQTNINIQTNIGLISYLGRYQITSWTNCNMLQKYFNHPIVRKYAYYTNKLFRVLNSIARSLHVITKQALLSHLRRFVLVFSFRDLIHFHSWHCSAKYPHDIRFPADLLC